MPLRSEGDAGMDADPRQPGPESYTTTAPPLSRRTLWWLLAAAAVPWVVATVLVLRVTR